MWIDRVPWQFWMYPEKVCSYLELLETDFMLLIIKYLDVLAILLKLKIMVYYNTGTIIAWL